MTGIANLRIRFLREKWNRTPTRHVGPAETGTTGPLRPQRLPGGDDDKDDDATRPAAAWTTLSSSPPPSSTGTTTAVGASASAAYDQDIDPQLLLLPLAPQARTDADRRLGLYGAVRSGASLEKISWSVDTRPRSVEQRDHRERAARRGTGAMRPWRSANASPSWAEISLRARDSAPHRCGGPILPEAARGRVRAAAHVMALLHDAPIEKGSGTWRTQ
jgi:hypothetical protein